MATSGFRPLDGESFSKLDDVNVTDVMYNASKYGVSVP